MVEIRTFALVGGGGMMASGVALGVPPPTEEAWVAWVAWVARGWDLDCVAPLPLGRPFLGMNQRFNGSGVAVNFSRSGDLTNLPKSLDHV